MNSIYCTRCRKKTKNEGPLKHINKNGIHMVKTECAQCHKLKSTFVKATSHQEPQDGEGITDIVERIRAFFRGPRNGFSPSIRKLLEQKSGVAITSITICRTPIQSAIQKIIDLVKARETPFDKLFHLYGLITLQDGSSYRFEKNQVIVIGPYNIQPNTQIMKIGLSKPVLFGEFFMKAKEQGGPDFFKYSALTNNCQDFIMTCLRANGLLTGELTAFIKQDVGNLVSPFLESIGKKITDLAGAVDVLQQGEGPNTYKGITSSPNGMSQNGFIIANFL